LSVHTSGADDNLYLSQCAIKKPASAEDIHNLARNASTGNGLAREIGFDRASTQGRAKRGSFQSLMTGA
jgi:hypothetical protein